MLSSSLVCGDFTSLIRTLFTNVTDVAFSFYIDVMGVITEVQSIGTFRPQSRSVDSVKITIQISDARNATLNVSLWGEKAADFPADDVIKASEKEPQVLLIVGILVKNYAASGLSLFGSSACKWYINPDIPEGIELKNIFAANYSPLKETESSVRQSGQEDADEKTIKQALEMNPHKFRRSRFLVNVTIRKLCNENSWWYNSCGSCYRTAKPFGHSFKCTGCYKIATPIPRYKVTLTAGDDTADAQFILFGKNAQRLTKKLVEALIDSLPEETDFIPDELTALIEKEFVWNVSFTENTLRTGEISFQVNSIVSCFEGNLLVGSSQTSQASSGIVSASATSSNVAIVDKLALTTPTKHTVNVPTSDTPTSKCSLIVLEEDTPLSLQSNIVSQGISEQTGIEVAAVPTNSAPIGVIPKKRGQPSSAQPVVKKLFKGKNKNVDDSAPNDP
ncbi:hypothetical protein GUJ93_ZPchr0014g47538 [Zizania palustris]|uniref:Replication protein A OB domain-containing protein n=1 Tax=Zizania palustris TaxID=103762 RepID=A0A8J5W5M4_ZIZPA|nr:hypothetical protein GUJ93_ZPchr0014g47538 [Zizania palustris]